MKKSTRPRGRPRRFDRDEVLDRAMTVFWSRGYNGASLDELTEAMRINRPSLYAAFGSKLELFLAVIDRYAVTFGCQPVAALQKETEPEAAVSAFLFASIRCVASPAGPKGCLLSTVAVEDAGEDEQIREKLSEIFAKTDQIIIDFFKSLKQDGSLSSGSDPQLIAHMLLAVTHSLAARARVGESREKLEIMAKEFVSGFFRFHCQSG